MMHEQLLWQAPFMCSPSSSFSSWPSSSWCDSSHSSSWWDPSQSSSWWPSHSSTSGWCGPKYDASYLWKGACPFRKSASDLLWSNPLSFVKCTMKEGTEALKYGGKHLLEKTASKCLSAKREYSRKSPLQKVCCGAFVGAAAHVIYSTMDNLSLLKNGEYGLFAREVLQDGIVGAMIGCGLATTFLISPTIGVMASMGFLLMPSLNAFLYDGFWSRNFFKRFGMVMIGLFSGSLLLPFGVIWAGVFGSVCSYFFNWLLTPAGQSKYNPHHFE